MTPGCRSTAAHLERHGEHPPGSPRVGAAIVVYLGAGQYGRASYGWYEPRRGHTVIMLCAGGDGTFQLRGIPDRAIALVHGPERRWGGL